MTIDTQKKEQTIDETSNSKPFAIILAGYNKIDSETRKKKIKEIREAYDGEEIYMGQNKFLHTLGGKPIIHYALDSVCNASKDDKPLYDKIYLYNDIKSINKAIDLTKYPNLIIKQMKDSIGGHMKDFYNNYISYGQRVDIFFGDTPRITSNDVEWIHEEYNNILKKKNDHKGVPISFLFAITEFEDMKDNWLEHRLKYIKVGRNKGKLKNFVAFKNFEARVGNSAALIRDECLDGLIKHKTMNFFYNLRKALTPNIFSKILYHVWKTKHFKAIKHYKSRTIEEEEVLDTAIDIISKLFKLDLSKFGMKFYHIKRNACNWENDIDGPRDLDAMEKKFKT